MISLLTDVRGPKEPLLYFHNVATIAYAILEAFRATFSRCRERIEPLSATLALVIHYGLSREALSEINVVGKILLKARGDLLYLLPI